VSDRPALPRPRPCATCPYRRDVPPGIWAPEEYERLPRYDGEPGDQSPASFGCHQADGRVCSGWLGHRDPWDLLAVRIGVLGGFLDPSCLSYETTVPLFPSGAEAAAHGLSGVEDPPPEAQAAMRKILDRRGEEPPGAH
jgi:Family of unknown function (DUF6283)